MTSIQEFCECMALKAASWTQVVLPLLVFEPRFRGRLVPDAPALRPETVKQLGLLISDKQAGAFRLMVKTIEAVATLTSAT